MSSTDSNNATEGNNLLRHGDPSNALEKAVGQANDTLRAWSTGMRFDIDPASKRIVISIIDSKTDKVLRTVPTDAVIRAAKMIVQLQAQSIDTTEESRVGKECGGTCKSRWSPAHKKKKKKQ